MTCIVGITDGTRIVMGGDSAGSSTENPEIYNVAVNKVFAVGEYLVGICGSYRAGQIARWEMPWPEPPAAGSDLESFIVRELVPAIRQSLLAAGSGQLLDGPKAAQFLIGLRGELYSIGGDFSAIKLEERWIAIGSGRHVAYGALHALADIDLDEKLKVLRALAAAQSYTASVRGPFHVLCIGEEDPGREQSSKAVDMPS